MQWYDKLFFRETDHILVQFFRYTFVGGAAFLIDFTILFLLTTTSFFTHYYLLAATISFIAGLCLNYALSVRWVFNKRNIQNQKLEFILFAVIGLIGLLLNAFFIWFFTEIAFIRFIPVESKQLRIVLSKILSTGFVYIWNFTARKFLLFK